VFLKTSNALCVCLQYKHPRSIKRVIRSDKPITSVFPVKSQKCDFGAEHRCHLFATSAGKRLRSNEPCAVIAGPQLTFRAGRNGWYFLVGVGRVDGICIVVRSVTQESSGQRQATFGIGKVIRGVAAPGHFILVGCSAKARL
jgi:hypothetical protein